MLPLALMHGWTMEDAEEPELHAQGWYPSPGPHVSRIVINSFARSPNCFQITSTAYYLSRCRAVEQG